MLGAEEREVKEAVLRGFPLKPFMRVERFKNYGNLDTQIIYEVLLETLDGTPFVVKWSTSELQLAQAYEPEALVIAGLREQIKRYFERVKEDKFHTLVVDWHFDSAHPDESFKKFINMTDEQYDSWYTTGEMPEGWTDYA